MRVNHVHLPAYLCKSLLLPVKALGFEYSFYPVELNLRIHPQPPDGSVVLIINYFGWRSPEIEQLLNNKGRTYYVIEDACQAFLSDWGTPLEKGHFVILSPRKFGPTSIGGWCNIKAGYEKSSSQLELLYWQSLTGLLVKSRYLSKHHAKIDTDIEAFYLQTSRNIEEFLDKKPLYIGLPQIALDIIAGIDWVAIGTARRRNWKKAHEILGKRGLLVTPDLIDKVVPLGYVLRLKDRDKIRERLRANRLFCPVHWDLPSEVDPNEFPEAFLLSNEVLTVPIDQRYNKTDIAYLANTLDEFLP